MNQSKDANTRFISSTDSPQVVDAYLPGAISSGKVTTVDFTTISDGQNDGCHADMVVFVPARAYFCTDLFFIEEGANSLLATDAAYLPYHSKTRDVVRALLKSRGFRQSFAPRI